MNANEWSSAICIYMERKRVTENGIEIKIKKTAREGDRENLLRHLEQPAADAFLRQQINGRDAGKII